MRHNFDMLRHLKSQAIGIRIEQPATAVGLFLAFSANGFLFSIELWLTYKSKQINEEQPSSPPCAGLILRFAYVPTYHETGVGLSSSQLGSPAPNISCPPCSRLPIGRRDDVGTLSTNRSARPPRDVINRWQFHDGGSNSRLDLALYPVPVHLPGLPLICDLVLYVEQLQHHLICASIKVGGKIFTPGRASDEITGNKTRHYHRVSNQNLL